MTACPSGFACQFTAIDLRMFINGNLIRKVIVKVLEMVMHGNNICLVVC